MVKKEVVGSDVNGFNISKSRCFLLSSFDLCFVQPFEME